MLLPCGLLFWSLLSCAREAPAAPGSRSAVLAEQTGRLGERAAVLAEQAQGLEGQFDALRAAAPEDRAAIRAAIRAEALAIREESGRIAMQVRQMEAAAPVHPKGAGQADPGPGDGDGGAGGAAGGGADER